MKLPCIIEDKDNALVGNTNAVFTWYYDPIKTSNTQRRQSAFTLLCHTIAIINLS